MALAHWWRRAWPGSVDDSRWLVVDAETTGLDVRRDDLVALAAVAVHIDWAARRAAIVPGDSFEVVVRGDRPTPDRANILLHGIGLQQQRAGLPPGEALQAFAAFAGRSPLLAFHSAFDEAILDRAFRLHLSSKLASPWVDIEHLCTALQRERPQGSSLDAWMAHFGIVCAQRHQAAADAMAEAEVLLRLWPALVREAKSWSGVMQLAAARRWLPPGSNAA